MPKKGSRKYTNEELIKYLKKFYDDNHRVPITNDFDNNKNFPSVKIYQHYFGSWNNGLIFAGLSVNKIGKLTGDEYCEICKSRNTINWSYKNNLRICRNCYSNDRNYLNGTLSPESTVGIGVITEYIVYKVLDDCIKCNTVNNFKSNYDLISKKYGTINVKSAKLHQHSENSFRWGFGIHESSKIPDYYICIGFDENKTEILKVWIIPSNFKLINKDKILITNSDRCLKKFKLYEVNHKLYNKVYTNLDITTLYEFRNLNKLG